MDDLTTQINALLGPDGMQKLQEMANVLVGPTGGASSTPSPSAPLQAAPPPQAAAPAPDTGQPAPMGQTAPNPPVQPTQPMNQSPPMGQSMPDPAQLMAMANMLGQAMGNGGSTAPGGGAGGLDPGALMRMGQLMQQMNQETPDTRLLQALRPHLHGERAGRIDEAMNIMRMMSILPALQQGGFFGGQGNR